MEVVTLCNQLATRYLAGHPRKWFHIGDSRLLCAAGRLCTRWWHSQVSLGERKFSLLILHINSIPASMASLCMGPLELTGGAEERGQVVSTGWVTHQLVYLNPPLPRSPFGEYLHGTQTYSHFLPIQRVLSTFLFPKFLCHLLFKHVPSKSLTI